MTDRVHGFSSPQDFARVVASAGHEDGWVAAGQDPEPFDLLALAHRLSLEWNALTEASNSVPDPLQGLLRCIARDVNAAVMLAFTAAEVRRQL